MRTVVLFCSGGSKQHVGQLRPCLLLPELLLLSSGASLLCVMGLCDSFPAEVVPREGDGQAEQGLGGQSHSCPRFQRDAR